MWVRQRRACDTSGEIAAPLELPGTKYRIQELLSRSKMTTDGKVQGTSNKVLCTGYEVQQARFLPHFDSHLRIYEVYICIYMSFFSPSFPCLPPLTTFTRDTEQP